MKEASFTKEEKILWRKIGECFGDFQRLEQTHPADMKDVVEAIHALQHVLGQRILRREFPGTFASYTNTDDKERKWVPFLKLTP